MIKVIDLGMGGVKLITLPFHSDQRGYFMESYSKRDLDAALGEEITFVQDNHSHSWRNVLRGLHYQYEHPQGKLVRVVSGEIYDVAVDLRRSSKTFGQWVGFKLNASQPQVMWIPPYCAHGFVVLSESADVFYKVTDYYCQPCELCLRWDDSEVGIMWPINEKPILSTKDNEGRSLSELKVFE